jgi:hypothetical protein
MHVRHDIHVGPEEFRCLMSLTRLLRAREHASTTLHLLVKTRSTRSNRFSMPVFACVLDILCAVSTMPLVVSRGYFPLRVTDTKSI